MSRLTLTEVTAPGLPGNGNARSCRVETRDGVYETPVFMPVGTQGTVKGVLPRDLEEMGAEIILGNTYHLWLRPGIEIMKAQGGLRKWMSWKKPLLTDSGGFQVFSLGELRKIEEDGVEFKSHLDGTKMFLSPEKSIEIQEAINSTIMMQLDVCPALPATREELQKAISHSTRWAKRCLEVRKPDSGALFGIVQGGLDVDLRLSHLQELAEMPFDGLALGGFAVGEEPPQMYEALHKISPQMPRNKPRYLMGVGTPQDLLHAVSSGIDQFDCVMPSRNARTGTLFTSTGVVRIRNTKWANDSGSLDPNCQCYTCKNFTLSYLRHLHQAGEILASVLCTIHNLAFYISLMKQARQAIREQRYEPFKTEALVRVQHDR